MPSAAGHFSRMTKRQRSPPQKSSCTTAEMEGEFGTQSLQIDRPSGSLLDVTLIRCGSPRKGAFLHLGLGY
jgi:hypothetical protein